MENPSVLRRIAMPKAPKKWADLGVQKSPIEKIDEEQMNFNPFDDLSLVQGYESWYANQGLRVDRLEKALLKWLIGHFQEPRSILDVGCGTGHFTRWFELLGLWAVGLDISPVMLREAGRFGMRADVRADASHLPFEDGALDLVAMITTLEFLSDHNA